MTPRPRKPNNRKLPPNLYRGAGGYFSYKHPHTGKYHGVGKNEGEAIAAANALNVRLLKTNSITNRILGASTIADVLRRFRAEYLADKKLAERTASETEYRLKRIERELGAVDWSSFELAQLTEWLKQLTREAYIKYRGLWIEIYRFACAVGISEKNIAELTLKKAPQERKRKRWTKEQVAALHAASPEWLRIAIRLAVITLQRREDLVGMKFDDIENERLLVTQHKTGKRLAIGIGPELDSILKQARLSGIACPFVIHRRPDKQVKSKTRQHWAAVTPSYLTNAIADVRDQLPCFAGWQADEKPTLHELRSFGAHEYRERGFDEEFIQALLGHETAKMTAHYLDGYKVVFDEVKAR